MDISERVSRLLLSHGPGGHGDVENAHHEPLGDESTDLSGYQEFESERSQMLIAMEFFRI